MLPGSVTNDRRVLLGSVGSDLWRAPKDPRDEFWMVTHRGPNGQIKADGTNRRTFLVQEFNPMILRVKTQGEEIGILEALPIVGQSGKPVTGLPNLTDINETAYNYSAQEPLNFNPNGLDTEGLVRTTAGDFWIAEEYGPSLAHARQIGGLGAFQDSVHEIGWLTFGRVSRPRLKLRVSYPRELWGFAHRAKQQRPI